MTFLWPMETTSPWASYDVFMADGNHFAMGVLFFLWQMETTSPWTSCDVFMADGNHSYEGFLWPMETTPMRGFMADGNHFAMDVL